MQEANEYLTQFQTVLAEPEVVTIINDGPYIKRTNYFSLKMANAGVIYASWNANECRLMLPDQHQDALDEIMSANISHVIMVTGKLSTGLDCIEFMFEDRTSKPYSITITKLATDESLNGLPSCHSRIHIYTSGGLQKTFTLLHIASTHLGY